MRSAMRFVVPSLVLVVALARPVGAEPSAALRERAAAIHRAALVVDGHNDVTSWIVDFGFDLALDGDEPSDRLGWPYLLAPWLPGRPPPERLRTETDFSRMERGGLDAQFFSVWVSDAWYDPDEPVPGRAFARANQIIDALLEQERRHPDRLALARSAGDVRRIAAEGRVAMLLGVEGGHAIEDELENLRRLHERGVRYMTLTWSFSHHWADSAGDARQGARRLHGGLTEFGRDVVREMNALGMLVDISHVSDETFWDVLETARAPLIASHSSARAVCPHPRNLSDDMLRAVAENGGVVMVNFASLYVDPRKASWGRIAWDFVRHLGGSETTVAHVAKHVDHIARVAGIDHVGLGSDFDGAPSFPSGLAHVGELPNLTAELLRRGYSEEDVRKVLGENALRVLGRAEELAAER